MFLIFLIITTILFSFTNQFAYICPKTKQSPPQKFNPSTTYELSSFTYNSTTYKQVELAKTIWLTNSIKVMNYKSDNQTNVCPPNYRIPVLSDFENLLSNLSSVSSDNVYNTINDIDQFNLPSGSYAISNTKADNDSMSFYFYTLYINETAGTVSIKNVSLKNITQPVYAKCIIDTLSPEIEITPQSNYNYVGDNKNLAVKNTNLIGSLWRINKDNSNLVSNNYNFSYSFVNNGINMIEIWYYDLLGYLHYNCKNIFIDKNVSYTINSFNFNNDYKKINTSVTVNYNNNIHFTYSNAPVAPRFHGGYYIAFKSKSDNFIHILSYDKNDNLLKNFNTEINGNVLDITATSIGFAIYISSVTGTSYHSFINIYNINFTLLKTINIMNNNYSNRNNKGDNIKQYTTNNNVVAGTEFMYNPLNGKLLNSNGRIYLIFSYNNYNGTDNTLNGDTIVSFNETGSDLDFSAIWGSSQSFIQTITEDKDWVWTATLSDKIGINVFHTSKINFTSNSYYYKERVHYNVSSLLTTITYTQNNFSYAKLGGLVYLPSYDILALVYSQTKDSAQGKNGIYMALFYFADLNYGAGQIPLKEYDSSETDIFNIRAGKLGNYLIVLYVLSTNSETVDKNGGNLPKGKNTMMMVINITGKERYTIVQNGILIGTDVIGTNEDMRNFKDGRLIWTSVDANGYVMVHRLGTLSDYNDNINDDDDVVTVFDSDNNESSSSQNNNSSGKKENSNNNSHNNNDDNKSSSNTGSIDNNNNSNNNNNSKNNSNNSKSKNSSSKSSNNENNSSSNNNNQSKSNNNNKNSSSNKSSNNNYSNNKSNNNYSSSSKSTSNKNNNNNNNHNDKSSNSNNKNKSTSSSTIENDSTSSSDDGKSNLLLYLLIIIIFLLLVILIIVVGCCCSKKSPENNDESKNDKKKKNDDDKENVNNNTHVSQATSNVNLNSNLGTNTISIYKDMNNLNNKN